jgi:hypothetical protein
MKKLCDDCGNELDDEELSNPRTEEDGCIICDRCYSDKYESYCPICENYYDNPKLPEETFMAISKEAAKEVGVIPGIYQVIQYPVTFGSIFGVESIYTENIKLLKACDIDSIMQKLQFHNKKHIGGSEICPDCAKIYSMKESYFRIRTQWCNAFMKLHENIYRRGVIQNGK